MVATMPPASCGAVSVSTARASGRRRRTLYFVVSAVFHYLGPAFAVLLFARVDVLGVAWLRIASAALIFAALAPALAALAARSTRAAGAAASPGARCSRS